METVLVAAAGLIFALVANALSPRGLRLNRDYFPQADKPTTVASGMTNTVSSSSPSDNADATSERLARQGLQQVKSLQVVAWFRDARYEQGAVVFVDARNEVHYAAGHIPGAWQFDHYHAERYLPTVLPICLKAEQVVVYCTGGDCEDSEFAAIILRDSGIPREKLFVYVGGITEWTTNGLPVETGERRSGQLIPRP